MKTITILGYSATITLLALSLIESRRISAIERINDFVELQTLKYRLIDEYLPNFNREQVFNILSAYVLDEIELKLFSSHLSSTGNLPAWSKEYQLENPKFYELLRYDSSVELHSLSRKKAINVLTHLKMTIFQHAPNILVEELCDVYIKEKLYELISLEDYYAIMILKADDKEFKMENPVDWRIRRALYSLAIRQYSPDLISNFLPIICFHRRFSKKIISLSIKENETTLVPRFMSCSNENIFDDFQSSSSVYDSSSHVIFLEILITDPMLIVNLNEIVNYNDRKVYYLFPNLILKALSDSVKRKTTKGLIMTFVKMETLPIHSTSTWLTQMANKIEDYKMKEREYFDNDPASLTDSDEAII